MKVDFNESYDGYYTCVIETEVDLRFVMEEHFHDIYSAVEGETYGENLRKGGLWSGDLNWLHRAVKYGCKLNGLPKWLVIK